MNKEDLIQTIKQWVKNDNEIRTLRREIKKRNYEKKELTDNLMKIMRNNEIDCFDIKDGSISYNKKNIKKPINLKFLHNILGQYFKEDDKALELEQFILSNREITTKETIVRKINKDFIDQSFDDASLK